MILQDFARERAKIPRYVYVGRLTREKGFDRIIEIAKVFLEHPKLGTLDICGGGEMVEELREKLGQFTGYCDLPSGETVTAGTQVVYHGFVSWSSVNELLKNSHYLLMPSRFLETFGLSALESISQGVPVIGYHKWGLSQFLLSEHALSDSLDESANTLNFIRWVRAISERFSAADWKRQSLTAQDISARYGRRAWIGSVSKIIPSGSKILFVSDYNGSLGGIETFIAGSRRALEQVGYVTDGIASQSGQNLLLRWTGLLFSWCNIGFSLRLSRRIKTFQPDFIWLNSIVRAIGPTGLSPLRRYTWQIGITYHDLGFFVAYPTEMEHESDLKPLSWKTFFGSVHRKSKIFVFHIWCKYVQLRRIRNILKKANFHMVPSAFMEEAVRSTYAYDQKVIVFPHCNPHE